MKKMHLFFLLLAAIVLLLSVPALADSDAGGYPEFESDVAEINYSGTLILDLDGNKLLESGYAYGDIVHVEILDRTMRGEIAIAEMPDVPYTGDHVIERLSTARSFAYDTLVRRCRETLESEFASPIRIADLAMRFRVSRRTLETHFRDVTGTTIVEEVCRLRIERAKHLLATTGDSQEEIATACGFYNASHLSATFRNRLGMRPSAFRGQP